MALVGLAVEADSGTPEHAVIGRDSIVREPLLPPIVVRIDQVTVVKVLWPKRAAKTGLRRANALRARHRREARLEQLVMLQPFPAAPAAADRDVGLARAQVDE